MPFTMVARERVPGSIVLSSSASGKVAMMARAITNPSTAHASVEKRPHCRADSGSNPVDSVWTAGLTGAVSSAMEWLTGEINIFTFGHSDCILRTKEIYDGPPLG